MEKKQPDKKVKVSVILSAYDEEEFLGEAIESILSQTFKDFEFILIDDGSIDGTYDIISSYAKKDPRIIPIYKKDNMGPKGVVRNLNEALDMAKGEYIARMDADDVALPERLEKQVAFLDKNRKISLVGSGALNIDEDGNLLSTFTPDTNSRRMMRKLVRYNQIYNPTIMFRNNVDVRYRDIFPCEDYDLFLQMTKKGYKLGNISEHLLKYRVLQRSHSHRDSYKTMIHTLIVQDEFNGVIREKDMSKETVYKKYLPEFCTKSILERAVVLSYRTYEYERVIDLAKQYEQRFGISPKVFFYKTLSSLKLFVNSRLR